MRWAHLVAIVLAGGLIVSAGGQSVAPASPKPRATSDYKLLVTRNIFARDRSVPYQGPVGPSWPTTPETRPDRTPSDEDCLVLSGTAGQGDRWLASFEDTRSRDMTLWVAPGQSIGPGKVVAITFDGVQYRNGATVRIVHIGENLAGGAPVESSAAGISSSAASSTASSQPAPSAGGGGIEGDILQKLRQRRLQEMNK
jgi:hypothetical protein